MTADWQGRLVLLAEGQCPLGHGQLTPDSVQPRVGVRAGRTINVARCDVCPVGWRLYRNEIGMIVEHIDMQSAGGLCGTAEYMLSEPYPWVKRETRT